MQHNIRVQLHPLHIFMKHFFSAIFIEEISFSPLYRFIFLDDTINYIIFLTDIICGIIQDSRQAKEVSFLSSTHPHPECSS